MARIFITGSSDGLGLLAARQLLADGHAVTLHARSEARAADARAAAPDAEGVLVGDLGSQAEVAALAEAANASGRFDAVIHNAGIYLDHERHETSDGVPRLLQINLLAPYVLTAQMGRPDRLVYLTSGLSRGGDPDLADLTWTRRRWSAGQAYADSKLWIAALAAAVARRWDPVLANAVNPGWVPTKMGGAGASDDLAAGADTQAWLAAGDDPAALAVTGAYLFHRRVEDPPPAVTDEALQDALLAACGKLTGVPFPA